MRPILMVENLANLHDARYCAAVGIDIVSFDFGGRTMESQRKAEVKEIAEWLSGTRIACRVSADEILEAPALAEAVGAEAILLPFSTPSYPSVEWEGIVLYEGPSPEGNSTWTAVIDSTLPGSNTYTVIDATEEALEQLGARPEVANRFILRFADSDTLLAFASSSALSPYGFCFGAFAKLVDGQLDYDVCDEVIAALRGE